MEERQKRSPEERKMLYWLGSIEGIGLARMKKILTQISPEELYRGEEEIRNRVKGIPKKCVDALVSEEGKRRAERDWKQLEKNHIRYISFFDEEYPGRLRSVYHPPKHLYAKGELPDPGSRTVAIVGARECTCYGRDMARLFGYRLAECGVGVISGMARGVDGWAHQGALESGGQTYAVLGCGVGICYPSEHRRLYDSIQKRGGILSEFSPWMAAKSAFFPLRNRIISGLSDGLLVVEARERSGSLITADAALEQGKDVFVIPGRIGDALSVGCNRLMRQGAIPVLSPDDILQYYGIENYNRKEREIKISGPAQYILERLGGAPVHINQIAEELHMRQTDVLKGLLRLKRDGLVREVARGQFIKYNDKL